jgi:hypothetical protein
VILKNKSFEYIWFGLICLFILKVNTSKNQEKIKKDQHSDTSIKKLLY